MITKADDYPIHQLPHPVSEVGTGRNFYDRYFFNGYSKKEDFYFAAVLCLYPNLNIMDASFTLAVDGKQHNIRTSRILGLERLNTKVGPIEVKVLEPLEKLSVELSENDSDITAKLEFSKRFDPMQEPNMTLFNGPRKIMDTCRLTQHGSWSGEIKIKDQVIKISPQEFVGTRDRSWGVRPVGAGDSQPMVPFEMPQFFWLWAPVHFDELATHIYYIDNEKYFIHIKTKGSIFTWVRYLGEFEVTNEWQDFEIEFTKFIRYSNKSPKKRNLNPSKIKLIGVEASGRDFDMDIDIASMSFSK